MSYLRCNCRPLETEKIFTNKGFLEYCKKCGNAIALVPDTYSARKEFRNRRITKLSEVKQSIYDGEQLSILQPVDLIGNDGVIDLEVKMSMKIPKEIMESTSTAFLKPSQTGHRLGEQETFTITGDVEQNNNLYSVKVKYKAGEGSFSLNKTNLRLLGKALGDETTVWKGSSFSAMVIPRRNPQSNQEVPAWTILVDSIKKVKA